jgi:hypothetical protein
LTPVKSNANLSAGWPVYFLGSENMLGICIAVALAGALFVVINEGSKLARPGSRAARWRRAILELFGREAYPGRRRPWLREVDPMEPAAEEPTLRPRPIPEPLPEPEEAPVDPALFEVPTRRTVPVARDEAETLAKAATWPLASLADEISSVRDLRWSPELSERAARHQHLHPVAPPRPRLFALVEDPLDEETHPRLAV